jgi:hypothetical protein
MSLHVVNVTLTDLGSLAFILHFLNQYWIAVSVKQWLEHCPWLVLQYCRQRLLWCILVRLAGLRCIVGVTALECAGIDWGEFCVLSFSFYQEVSAMQIGF